MYLQEFFAPVAILTTALYLITAVFFAIKSKKNGKDITEIKDSNHAVKNSLDGVNDKVQDLSKSMDEQMVPILKNVESEIKKMHTNFELDVIFEKIKNHGYPHTVKMDSGKIVSFVKWELDDDQYFHVTHFITVEPKHSSVLVESYAIKLNSTDENVFRLVLEENFKRKKSDFGLTEVGGNQLVIAQDYIRYPESTFHYYPLVESMDDLERSFLKLKEAFDTNDVVFDNFDIAGFREMIPDD